MFVVEIIYNLAILIAISIVAVFIDARWPHTSKRGALLQGLMFGLAAIIGMMQPFNYAPGIFFDGRTVLLSICALFFGPVSAAIAAAIAFLYRLYIGGSGVSMGLSIIVASTLIGIFFHFNLLKRKQKINSVTLLMLGLLVHLAMIFLMVLLPSNLRVDTFKTIGATIILVFPLATILIGKILSDQQDRSTLTLKLKNSEAQYRLLVENQSDLVVKVDNEGRFIYVSYNYCETFGKTEDELIGNTFLPLVHEDDRETTQTAMKKLYSPPYSCYLEQRALTKDGWRWFGWSDKALINELGRIESIIGVGRDITEKKLAEEQSEKNRIRLENAENIAKLGSWEVDFENNTFWWSKQMFRIFRLEPDINPPSNEDFLNLIHPDDREKINGSTQNLFLKKLPIDFIHRTNPEHGTVKYLKPNHQIIKNKQGETSKIIGTVLDITETINAQNETLASREELSITLMSIGDGVIATDTSGNITRMNPVAEQLTGFSIEEAKGMHLEKVFRIVDSETNLPVDCPFKKVIESGQTVDLSNHTLLISRNGKQYHIADSAAPIINKEGQIIGVILVFSNVSSRYKIQNELNKERNLLRKVIDALPFSLYIKDKTGKKILVNQTEIKYIGKPIEDIIGKTDFEVYKKEYAEIYWADDSEVINKQTIITDRQEPVPDNNGNIRWVSTNKIPWLDENGNVLGLIGFGIDITDRIADQMKIKRLSEGIEQSPNAVIITDQNGKIEYVNPRFEEMTGYTLEHVKNKYPRVMKPYKNETSLHVEIWEALKNKQKWEGEYLSKKASGEKYWEQIIATPIFDNNNNVSNILLIIEDITDRKKMIEDLKVARDKAEESDKLKSAFLANMSHEIRTPMNGILGFAELLRESHLKKDTKDKYLELIEQSGYRMLNIINDIIDISKIEAGQISLYIKPTAINKIIQHQFDFFKTEIERKGLKFNLNKGLPDGEDILETDAQRLEQVITNLLKNAIKFTNQGEIELGYYQYQSVMRFYVRDTGIGIDENLKEQVFERFRQGELLLTKQYEGAGLGLSISKAFVEMMGGQMGIETKKGSGSTFYFDIPLK